jgi:hypothetical protein
VFQGAILFRSEVAAGWSILDRPKPAHSVSVSCVGVCASDNSFNMYHFNCSSNKYKCC